MYTNQSWWVHNTPALYCKPCLIVKQLIMFIISSHYCSGHGECDSCRGTVFGSGLRLIRSVRSSLEWNFFQSYSQYALPRAGNSWNNPTTLEYSMQLVWWKACRLSCLCNLFSSNSYGTTAWVPVYHAWQFPQTFNQILFLHSKNYWNPIDK